MEKLSITRQKSCTICSYFAIFFAQPKLHSKPIELKDIITCLIAINFKLLVLVNTALFLKQKNQNLTVANFSTSESDAPNEASPISWENCANKGSANIGA